LKQTEFEKSKASVEPSKSPIILLPTEPDESKEGPIPTSGIYENAPPINNPAPPVSEPASPRYEIRSTIALNLDLADYLAKLVNPQTDRVDLSESDGKT
jgi:hypothetical protein